MEKKKTKNRQNFQKKSGINLDSCNHQREISKSDTGSREKISISKLISIFVFVSYSFSQSSQFEFDFTIRGTRSLVMPSLPLNFYSYCSNQLSAIPFPKPTDLLLLFSAYATGQLSTNAKPSLRPTWRRRSSPRGGTKGGRKFGGGG